MGKSRHDEWLIKNGSKHRVFRKKTGKYDVLEYSRYEQET